MKYIIDFIASSITLFFGLKCLSLLFKTKLKINVLNIIIILLGSLVLMFYTYFGDNVTRPLIGLVVICLCSLIIFKNSIYISLFYSLVCNILIGLYEIVLSLIFVKLKIIDLNYFDSSSIIKAVFSFIVLILVYFTLKVKHINYFINKVVNNIKIIKFIIILLIMLLLIIMVVDFKYSQSITYKDYLSNIIIIVCLIVTLIIIIKDHFQIQNEMHKSDILLNFMKKYEKIIDGNRESNHEILNNLLILKSMKNKNSKEYNNILDELIDNSSNKGMKIKKVYNLPSGIKGVFYYKLYGLDEKGYDISFKVNERVNASFKKVNHSNYIALAKVIAIVLDNSIEASASTDNKCIIIDIYTESKCIIFDIVNSYKGKININSLNDRKYSTKGKNRGYGLYIMKKILKDNDCIKVEQSIKNHYFYTKIIVKEK